MLPVEKRIKDFLVNCGLNPLEAEIYLFLCKQKSKKGRNIVKALKVSKQQVYRALKSLRGKGLLNATLDYPAQFSAIPFERMLNLFVEAKAEDARSIRQIKQEILSDWNSLAIVEVEDESEKFTVMKGRAIIYSKIQQLIQQTKRQLFTMTTVPDLIRADQFGLLDVALNHPKVRSIEFRFLTELSKENMAALKDLFEKLHKKGLKFRVRSPELGLKLQSRLIIRDDEEAIFFINRKGDTDGTGQDDVCLWTNCKSLVNSFLAAFDDFWVNASDVKKRITELEAGIAPTETRVISDAETACSKYNAALNAAGESIIMLTSSKGLLSCGEDRSLIEKWAKRGVVTRIMAPIIGETLEATQQLLKTCEVRHVPSGYLETTIIDKRHLFQFKNPPAKDDEQDGIKYFDRMFYTDDSEYVAKTANMLNYIWRNAVKPSTVTIESIINPSSSEVTASGEESVPMAIRKIKGISLVEEKTSRKLTEKQLLRRMVNTQKTSEKIVENNVKQFFGAAAQAVVHPPASFGLPDLLFHIMHFDKHSTYGAQDCMIICLRLETAKGHAYVSTAFVGDNPKAMPFWRKTLSKLPIAKNLTLMRKSEFQVQVHGKTLFAGWTVGIPLLFKGFVLPPSFLLIEGYGEIKTFTYTVDNPSGYRVINDVSGFEAFVTFYHPSSRYSGPGTEGFISRETISKSYRL